MSHRIAKKSPHIRRVQLEAGRESHQAELERITLAKRCVLSVVSSFLEFPQAFYSNSRDPLIVVMRMALASRIRDHFRAPYPLIALALGRPNHSTIVTAHKRWTALPERYRFGGANMGQWNGAIKGHVAEVVAHALTQAGAEEIFGIYRLTAPPPKPTKPQPAFAINEEACGYFGA